MTIKLKYFIDIKELKILLWFCGYRGNLMEIIKTESMNLKVKYTTYIVYHTIFGWVHAIELRGLYR